VNMRVSAAFGGLGNPAVRALREADAVLDISGGDSFTDLYGRKRFRSMTIAKDLAIRLGAPLVLMPQTYGPYDHPHSQAVAQKIVRGAAMAIARDRPNFETLRELVGPEFDPARHREGVDVAFALPRQAPADTPDWLTTRLTAPRSRPLVGFNVSGLIYNPGSAGSRQFGFRADYQDLVHGALERLLGESDADILLVPHVLEKPGSSEGDTPACHAVAKTLNAGERVHVLDRPYGPTEVKWVISQLDYFCGTRMHSTIAGLSSKVPTTAVAYSKKTKGVFETCGQGQHVTDPRHEDTPACVATILRGFAEREATAASLEANVPAVVAAARAQFEAIFDLIDSRAHARAAA